MHYVKWMIIATLLSVFGGCQTSGPQDLRPFTTDGCSQFPDGTATHKTLWLKCCTVHDQKYWAGGTFDERLKADQDLRACVKSVGEPAVAELMLAGVRVGGSPWWPTRFRWGYGWPYTHGYRALTSEELNQVRKFREIPFLK